ncbi:centriole, cilia and spindle-associated protein [Anas platyrhynchos]|uniref:Centriole, cilia and spindle associated protein n=1 Tax=Anas platyrhynchos platyrhynchos TaxID=8840 RepID=A0A493TR43_ANAPP|nr:centriole, cilia and spindle-associated protein [Anas platyrhynchos]XP_027309967.1 centriole, cilia and spindle-associated protein [Anas platyrhynchos]XP_038032538.1 centriole, cilia and spindle-associated protein [Anas platyrhynchos]|eukprot:XP_027309966.1 centriole, cilia and spindle-associated protein [Anas platyrhynchos]
MVVPARRVQTEYMKRFREPQWDACGACYLELLRYRLSRRLLEQAHRPWLWDGWQQGGGSSSGNSSSTAASPSPPPAAHDEEEAGGEAGRDGPAPGPEKEREDQEKHQKEEQEKTVEQTSTKEADKTSRTGRRPSRSALSSRNDRRSAKSPQKTDAPKENKHPFALYGWGEKQTDTGSQKTHNVCASASVNEIHESALRAKNRRQVEKRKLSQRRVRSAETEKPCRIKPPPPDNPWMTEYMRCYSARAR